ncbi:PhoH family protein [Arthrobacter sp. TPD3018]|jgi:phosphate starvation-inducible protein PhoH and related proteins|uniref:PhoH-like protein n=1 Tax=Sphingomonas melonis TY TaxID=621456 RepID=A0A154NB42_9SPHN|nr:MULTISPECIES: PhoH family protein [Bacteria]ANC88174.1 phosphate starvation-inducible protein PhoH [Sphingomonas sp. NIC1]AOW23677.1 phosphate starvation-inducible protein PhoH [Sphingomonas melonis TY]ATI54679.1 PhoH family protein [Sphingomonas melonis]KZB96938.1 phosphate starvation-inducible protein PhoH [Sphingomonas melonis TY]MBI0531152.1 PhoH family protein [Sphingomonas sp. TX0522]
MSRKPVPARSGERSRAEVLFDKPQLLATLFGQYDQNLVALENRLGVYITARGNRVGLEGAAENVALARDVLQDLYQRIQRGEEIDTGLVDASIAMAAEPTLDGIVSTERSAIPSIMIRTRKKTIVPRTPAQAHYMRELSTHDMIFALGPAGTGKTYIAVAQAVSQLITGSVQRLILSRPAVEAGEKLGFLPGDMKDKVDPYLRPLYDALHDCLPAEQVERRIASGEIEIAPIAFMRGRTLADAFVILDEAQNTTPAQMKMFLTRFGQNSRMVICGDPNQTDLPGGVAASGLADATMRLEGVEGISMTRFSSADVVRHPIVGRIVEAYEGANS